MLSVTARDEVVQNLATLPGSKSPSFDVRPPDLSSAGKFAVHPTKHPRDSVVAGAISMQVIGQ